MRKQNEESKLYVCGTSQSYSCTPAARWDVRFSRISHSAPPKSGVLSISSKSFLSFLYSLFLSLFLPWGCAPKPPWHSLRSCCSLCSQGSGTPTACLCQLGIFELSINSSSGGSDGHLATAQGFVSHFCARHRDCPKISPKSREYRPGEGP
jgi:hypothetical protein